MLGQQACVTGAIPEQCNGFDVECICGDEAFIDKMACCVSKECEGDDIDGKQDRGDSCGSHAKHKLSQQTAVLSFANGICTGAGVNVPTKMPPNPCGNEPSATKSSTTESSATKESSSETASASSSESADFAAPTATAHTGMMAAVGAAGAMAALGLL